MFDEIKKRIKEIGILETSRRTGISRSRINDFVAKNRSINSDNLEKIMRALFFNITNSVLRSVESINTISCDPLKKDIIAAIILNIRKHFKPYQIFLIEPQSKNSRIKYSLLEFLVVLEDDADKSNTESSLINEEFFCNFDITFVSRAEFDQDKESLIKRSLNEFSDDFMRERELPSYNIREEF